MRLKHCLLTEDSMVDREGRICELYIYARAEVILQTSVMTQSLNLTQTVG